MNRRMRQGPCSTGSEHIPGCRKQSPESRSTFQREQICHLRFLRGCRQSGQTRQQWKQETARCKYGRCC
ncbi:hypothetical protein ATCV1_z655R [Acanthocystis turfacea chlorella virus 1]|uniref:Uncharacterized protein z655R n=1 Tax=Chlorovirus heliozoae TaxID=322019 RepID=A7K9R5_9PHYC|nr:hypothetical protein ATCV1_z655R [Acanthocystis turfacea chlorella virus 1]ABT16789.1 hypothetical protein ATCV1_z655R [Acanthocystis turfacea chlorella virus 1]